MRHLLLALGIATTGCDVLAWAAEDADSTPRCEDTHIYERCRPGDKTDNDPPNCYCPPAWTPCVCPED